jgi:anaerobic selenocysteine-containing dehydrogenase
MGKGVVQTFCQNCHMKCRIFVTLRDGKVQAIANAVDVEGAKTLPAYEEVIHPDRVIRPLRRAGNRGEGKWRPISWDEALDRMAERFGRIKETYGAEAIASLRG